ncbi:hypothetical protein DFA_05137 [Cavenderia fasciculata]|uniref:Uncharacterized protein n=1 Tax=Cavenderia fasciculata TaxID=261658 RepID=F4PNF4_CACFS|nr:uncharacterized protein DFA_05137 [Cavenderia fasciculata]EGG23007.1 hypothetical protein DFA_05137 [Cavenderia fasciculata]|eukprot:XP_004360858.1 hypothetical protein DFA_05137 [Cavenderia fasciculata]
MLYKSIINLGSNKQSEYINSTTHNTQFNTINNNYNNSTQGVSVVTFIRPRWANW